MTSSGSVASSSARSHLCRDRRTRPDRGTGPFLPPEQLKKVQKVDKYLANQTRTCQTGHHIDAATLPRTFPFKEVAQHVVVDVAFGDDPAVPFMFDTGAPTLVSKAIQ